MGKGNPDIGKHAVVVWAEMNSEQHKRYGLSNETQVTKPPMVNSRMKLQIHLWTNSRIRGRLSPHCSTGSLGASLGLKLGELCDTQPGKNLRGPLMIDRQARTRDQISQMYGPRGMAWTERHNGSVEIQGRLHTTSRM